MAPEAITEAEPLRVMKQWNAFLSALAAPTMSPDASADEFISLARQVRNLLTHMDREIVVSSAGDEWSIWLDYCHRYYRSNWGRRLDTYTKILQGGPLITGTFTAIRKNVEALNDGQILLMQQPLRDLCDEVAALSPEQRLSTRYGEQFDAALERILVTCVTADRRPDIGHKEATVWQQEFTEEGRDEARKVFSNALLISKHAIRSGWSNTVAQDMTDMLDGSASVLEWIIQTNRVRFWLQKLDQLVEKTGSAELQAAHSMCVYLVEDTNEYESMWKRTLEPAQRVAVSSSVIHCVQVLERAFTPPAKTGEALSFVVVSFANR